MKKYKSQSTEIPNEWDLDSSETSVYHNYNIITVPTTEVSPEMYEYMVEEYTKEEYYNYKSQQQDAENEMLMMALAELDMQREADKTEAELAIAELAETVLGGV